MKKWNTRWILLTYSAKTLSLSSGPSPKKSKVINLEQYTIEWRGKTNNKKGIFVLHLQALDPKDKKLKYKNIYLGEKNEQIAKDWFETLKKTQI